MSAKLAIRGATLLGAARRPQVADLFIEGARIAAVGKAPRGFGSAKTLNAAGLHVAPAMLDRIAAAPPAPATLKGMAAGGSIRAVARRLPEQAPPSAAQCHLLAPLLDEQTGALADLAAAASAGCVGFWWQDRPVMEPGSLLRAMRLAAGLNLPVAADPRIYSIAGRAVLAAGSRSLRLGLDGMPAAAEAAGAALLIECAAEAGCRLHLAGVSCARTLGLLVAAQARGEPVTADAHAASVLLHEDEGEDFSLKHRLWPPLRDEAQRDALSKALADGTIAGLVTAHDDMPAEREGEPFEQAAAGVAAAGLQLSLGLEWALRTHSTPAAAAQAAWIACGRRLAEVYGIPLRLAEGERADLVVFDVKGERVVSEHEAGIGAASPFAGMRLPGEIVLALVGGRAARSG